MLSFRDQEILANLQVAVNSSTSLDVLKSDSRFGEIEYSSTASRILTRRLYECTTLFKETLNGNTRALLTGFDIATQSAVIWTTSQLQRSKSSLLRFDVADDAADICLFLDCQVTASQRSTPSPLQGFIYRNTVQINQAGVFVAKKPAEVSGPSLHVTDVSTSLKVSESCRISAAPQTKSSKPTLDLSKSSLRPKAAPQRTVTSDAADVEPIFDETLIQAVNANFPFLWVTTTTLNEAAEVIKSASPSVYDWTVLREAERDPEKKKLLLQALAEFVDADQIRESLRLPAEKRAATPAANSTLLLQVAAKDQMRSGAVIQKILSMVPQLQTLNRTLIICSEDGPPPLLEKYAYQVDLALPTRDAIRNLITSWSAKRKASLAALPDLETLIDSALGLSKPEIHSALNMLLLNQNLEFGVNVLADFKAEKLQRSGLLRIEKLTELNTFENVHGLDRLKTFLTKTVDNPNSRGILLLGVPGCGKSELAKALGHQFKRKVISLSFDRFYQSLVGASEARAREGLSIVTANAPCILFVDEVEKSLSGAPSSSRTDSGTAMRVFNTFLSFLDNPHPGVYIIGTCNSLNDLPPEFLRSGRWDAKFFIDYPDLVTRVALWERFTKEFSLPETEAPKVNQHLLEEAYYPGWSGADIFTCCRIASALHAPISEAVEYVTPLTHLPNKSRESIQELRDTAGRLFTKAGKSLMDDQAPNSKMNAILGRSLS